VETVKEHVAVAVVVRVLRPGAVLKQDVAAHSEPGGEGGCLTRVVGLGRALRHHHLGVPCLRLGHQKLELTGLISPGGEPRAVVALDPDLWTAELA
jgi:hypothetical protein